MRVQQQQPQRAEQHVRDIREQRNRDEQKTVKGKPRRRFPATDGNWLLNFCGGRGTFFVNVHRSDVRRRQITVKRIIQ